MNFDKLLEDGFANIRDTLDADASRLEYLSDHIFDSHDLRQREGRRVRRGPSRSEEATSAGATFYYIADPVQYRWYLLMVNMPFFC